MKTKKPFLDPEAFVPTPSVKGINKAPSPLLYEEGGEGEKQGYYKGAPAIEDEVDVVEAMRKAGGR